MKNVERNIHALILRYQPSIWLNKLSKTTKYINTYIYIYIYVSGYNIIVYCLYLH